MMKRIDAHWDTSMFLGGKAGLGNATPDVSNLQEPNEIYSSLEDLPFAHCDYKRMRRYLQQLRIPKPKR